MNHLRSTWAVFSKDVREELRTRHSLGAILLFAVTSTIAVSFTLGAWGSKSAIASSLLWLVIYFSAMSGLSRSFVREEETGSANLLRLTTPPNCVFLGKLGFNFALLIAIELVTVPLFVTLAGCSVNKWGWFIAVLVLGSLGLSVGATMAAAMVSRAATRGALFAVVSFPLLIPVLAVAIHGTNLVMDAKAISSAAGDIRILVYYCGMVTVASLMMFRFIWEN